MSKTHFLYCKNMYQVAGLISVFRSEQKRTRNRIHYSYASTKHWHNWMYYLTCRILNNRKDNIALCLMLNVSYYFEVFWPSITIFVILFSCKHLVSYCNTYEHLPKITPIDRRMMKGLLLPKLDLHRSDKDPMIGVRKNPIKGDKHHISVMCLWSTPGKVIEISVFVHHNCYIIWVK